MYFWRFIPSELARWCFLSYDVSPARDTWHFHQTGSIDVRVFILSTRIKSSQSILNVYARPKQEARWTLFINPTHSI